MKRFSQRLTKSLGSRAIAATLALLIPGMGALASVATVNAQLPAKFTNLQVLPKDITQKELVSGIMRGFALNLGVRCEHCHVGEGNDLSKFDFAADTKPAKAVARRMLRMTMELNQQVAAIGEPAAAGAQKITCYTCHRGSTKPLTAPGGGI